MKIDYVDPREDSIFISVRSSIQKKIRSRVLLSQTDIRTLTNLCSQSKYSFIFCRQQSKRANHCSPTLSLLITHSEIRSFDSKSEMDKKENEFRPADIVNAWDHKSQHYTIFGTAFLSRKNIIELGNILDEFFENSIIKVSIDRDREQSITERIRETLSHSRHSGLDVLPKLVLTHCGMMAVVVRVQNDKIVTQNSIENFSLCSLLAEVLSIDVDIEPLNVNRRSYDSFEKEFLLEFPESVKDHLMLHSRPTTRQKSTSPQWAAIADAIHFGKPQFFEIDRKNSIDQIVVSPIRSGELFQNGKVRSRPRYLLFSKSNNGLKRSSFEKIEHILHGYIHQRTIENRLLTLANARKKLQSIPTKYLEPEEISYPKLLAFFSDFSNWIASETIVACAAHSMTIRLYEHASRSLSLVASANDPDGKYQGSSSLNQISIKKNRLSSLNAFVFANSSSKYFQHAYLPRIDAREVRASHIPKDLRRLGLRTAMSVRPNTQSEICLPIRLNSVPIGTINIESPTPDGFSDSLEFLHAVRNNIEEAYEKTIGFNDIRSLSQQIAMHAAVHELDQYINLEPAIFSEEQRSLLTDLFRLRSTEDEQQLDLKNWLYEWVDKAYPNQTLETKKKIVDLVQIRSIQPDRINSTQWKGIHFLLKNLVQNVVSHGSIESEDGNSIVVDDRPLFGVGENNFLRISSKQHAIRDQEILDRVCVAPIQSRNGGARYGMLLIGMITRTLGGQVFVGRDASRAFTECLIKIPYPPKEGLDRK